MPKIHPLPLLIFLIFSIVLIAIATLFKKEPIPLENFYQGSKNILFNKENNDSEIAQLITETANKQQGRWAVYVKDINRQKTYEYKSTDIFSSASLYKLAVMYKTYDELENGELQKNSSVSGNKASLDTSLQGLQNKEADNQDTETISFNVQEALRLMITVSDNYSALLLSDHLGWTNIDQLMENEGFGDINLVGQDSPTVSAKSVGDLLERIYSNKAISPTASEEMRQLLFAQKINDRIPKYLPVEVKVGHKTGELDQIRHDAGIILGKNSNYIFVFLTETQKPLDAAETIASLSKQIFDELEK